MINFIIHFPPGVLSSHLTLTISAGFPTIPPKKPGEINRIMIISNTRKEAAHVYYFEGKFIFKFF